MKESIYSVVSVLIYVLLFGAYGLGTVHSFQKHGVGDGLIGAVVFPWAMYRGVEFWWHDDYADVDWDKRLNSDIHSSIYFFETVGDKQVDKYQVNESIDKFSKKIGVYPADKKLYIMNATKAYLDYGNSMSNDLLLALREYSNNYEYDLTFSKETVKLEGELIKYGLRDHIEVNKKAFISVGKSISQNVPIDISNDDLSAMLNKMDENISLAYDVQKNENARIFEAIFNKKLN